MNLIKCIVSTKCNVGSLIARLTLGLVMFPHGAQKALGWFGGYGFHGTMGFFTGTMHIPALFAVLAIAAEFLGSLGMIVGLFSRIAAFGIASTMVVAIATVHASNGFFMNWNNTVGAKEGFEYHLLAIGLALIVIIQGGGALSLDRILSSCEKSSCCKGHNHAE